jgi:calcineurin-like phosphoesterase family protein
MNEYWVDGWNKMVTGRDITYILGDFAWKNHSKFLGRLKGKKILIRGNHDRMSREVLKLFTEVHDIREVKLPNGRTAVCCHYCLNSWNHSNKGAYHFHGHSHGRLEEKRGLLRCDVGVDVWDYQPVPVEVLIEKMKVSENAWCGYEKFPGEANEFIGRNHSANRAMRKKLGLPSLAMDRETEFLG